jgi:hypothetical protein
MNYQTLSRLPEEKKRKVMPEHRWTTGMIDYQNRQLRPSEQHCP